jgi:heavy metal sensor kinase
MQRLRSLRVRLTLWYVFILGAVLAVFAVGIYLTLRNDLYNLTDDSLETRAVELNNSLRFDGDTPSLDGVISELPVDEGEEYVRLYDAQGNLQFDSRGPEALVPPLPADVERALGGESFDHSQETNDETMRVRFSPVRREGEVVGVLEVGQTEEEINETLGALTRILIVGYPLVLAIATVGGIFIAGRALAPIDRVTGMARRIQAEDLGQRLNLDLPDDELGRLARTFDDMIARLDEAFKRQRQFTADASHELRTPLTAIKGQIEVALDRPRDPESYREVLQTVNEEVDRTIRLTGSLLTLARADAGQIPLARDRIEIARLVEGASEHFAQPAAERKLSLEVLGGPPASVVGDEDLLLQLLLNLLDNALKYTPEGGRVRIGWQRSSDSLELRVDDTGIGIAEEDRERIFDRFYRVDKARSRADGGSGIGLSISRWIAGAHGGSLVATSNDGQGSAFILTLPVRAS